MILAQSPRVVRTVYGRVRGIQRTLPNFQPVIMFKGIQFASLVGSEMRFMPSISPHESWSDVRIMSDNGPVCPQRIPSLEKLQLRIPHARLDHIKRLIPFLRQQSEDCLFMNIFVPQSGKSTPSNSRQNAFQGHPTLQAFRKYVHVSACKIYNTGTHTPAYRRF